MLPSIIISANYLIVPYSRSTVTIITVLPALAGKLIFPHVIDKIPRAVRPAIFSVNWIFTTILSILNPPNVPPPLRIAMCVLAAATWSATEVSYLGRLHQYGPTALNGWGIGTGLARIACAVWPYLWTVKSSHTLRDATPFALYFIGVLAVAFYLVPANAPHKEKTFDDGIDEEAKSSLLRQDSEYGYSGAKETAAANLSAMSSLVRPYMMPLYSAAVVQAFVIPGLSRAYGRDSFGDYYTAQTAYGICMAVGVLIGRMSLLVGRVDNTKPLAALAITLASAVAVDGIFVFTTSRFMYMFCFILIGALAATVYINVYANAASQADQDSGPGINFGLAVIGSADTLGFLIGTLTACAMEWQLCGGGDDTRARWCSKPVS